MNHDESRPQDNGGQGTTLLGAPSRRGPMNVFPLWKNILVATVCLLGALFAAPNVFQPDPAVQIRSLDADASIGAAQKSRVLAALDEAGVTVIGVDEDDGSLLVRLQDEDAQLGARSLISDTLNDNVREFVVALAQAPTTPKWLQDLGGKPMSLGLDLFGGAHFLLQVNMQDYIAGVVDNSA